MDFKNLIVERRSTRNYADKKVPLEVIQDIVNDSILAPSWKNGENTRYYLAYEEETISKVRAALPDFNKASTLNAVYLVTTFIKDKSGFNIKEGQPVNELGNSWGVYDAGLHDAYLILSAKDHDVDSLIMGIRDEESLRKTFSIPSEEVILSVISLGYGEGIKASVKRKRQDEILKIK